MNIKCAYVGQVCIKHTRFISAYFTAIYNNQNITRGLCVVFFATFSVLRYSSLSIIVQSLHTIIIYIIINYSLLFTTLTVLPYFSLSIVAIVNIYNNISFTMHSIPLIIYKAHVSNKLTSVNISTRSGFRLRGRWRRFVPARHSYIEEGLCIRRRCHYSDRSWQRQRGDSHSRQPSNNKQLLHLWKC